MNANNIININDDLNACSCPDTAKLCKHIFLTSRITRIPFSLCFSLFEPLSDDLPDVEDSCDIDEAESLCLAEYLENIQKCHNSFNNIYQQEMSKIKSGMRMHILIVDPPVTIYMGKDKYENDDLIKYGFPEDICAHVYVRLQPGQTWLDIPPEVVDDCAQLVKANSIEGNKKNNITVIYTPWDNLKKTPGMETGQVTFHNHKKVKRVYVEKRINEVVNRLNKTKVERFPDLLQEKVQRDKIDRKKARSEEFAMKEEAQRLAEEKRRAEKEINDLFDPSLMKSNYRETEVEDINAAEEDFM
ncbi:hypothetical protein G6F44_000441 [Rhizopus delemar]|nr:hypothetical protein G6F44_000441 [Rhizopus delemar]